PGQVEVVIAPPFTSLGTAAEVLQDTPISLAAQNVHPKDQGAFTGEISPVFLVELGCEYVIVGHSERREYFLESDDFINQKVKTLLAKNLKPILCVGERLEHREQNQHYDIVGEQVINGVAQIESTEMEKIVIAYEPVWAIGTGKVATSEQIDEMHLFIRKVIERRFNSDIAAKVRIQYGGSVKPDNAAEILGLPNVDGALVGGASLKTSDFLAIVKAC
ncbi:MAG: triose-phosphate isomerase, partial [Bdellovibrionales bacterium]|nr:triose-phosphate isomerase [Bdellovibrionales bacterium]